MVQVDPLVQVDPTLAYAKKYYEANKDPSKEKRLKKKAEEKKMILTKAKKGAKKTLRVEAGQAKRFRADFFELNESR